MNLQGIRTQIDKIDFQVVDLLNERMNLGLQIGKLKREGGYSVFAPEREEELLKTLEERNTGPLRGTGLRAIYREILSASRASQSKLRIVYLENERFHGFLAARVRFGASDCYRGARDWKGAIESLENDEADVAVIPRRALCDALIKLSAEKLFSRLLRVCGEINLDGESPDDLLESSHPIPKKEAEQFFILTKGDEKKNTEGKSLFLFLAPKPGKLSSDFQQLVTNNGGSVKSVESVLESETRFLCEVEGGLRWEQFTEEALRHWGPSARLVLLGTYPCSHIYG